MRTLYFDCGMGAAGDMLTAALLELMPDKEEYVKKLNGLGIPDVVFTARPSVKCGITGTHMSVTIGGIEEGEVIYPHQPSHGEHSHSHEHTHEHSHALENHDHPHAHTHDGVHFHYHDDEGHTHEVSHEHTHEHTHSHDGHTHSHSHSGLSDIKAIVDGLNTPDKVKDDVMAVYTLIAQAESKAHGTPIDHIHFHEVGTMDAVADITAVCLMMNELAPEKVVVSPIHVGSGHVKCAHGILPVPAPATAFILQDVPMYGGELRGELCTPTGAALLKHFATEFGGMPVIETQSIGYGMGKKDFPMANCVRVLLGESGRDRLTDKVIELSCNVDDMTAEAIGFATERLFEGGAREVYTIPAGMKKGRPGTLIRVICTPADGDKMAGLLFKYTTTIGIRKSAMDRYTLKREMKTYDTSYGTVRCKVSTGYGVEKVKFEFDDLARIAKEKGITLRQAEQLIKAEIAK